jgi:hypothetical protein
MKYGKPCCDKLELLNLDNTFLTIIDLIGFGIVLPLLPGYAEDNFRPDFNFQNFSFSKS